MNTLSKKTFFMKKIPVIITVEKHGHRQGYTLRHNQEIGWYGTTRQTFGWYKFKSDAVQRAKALSENP